MITPRGHRFPRTDRALCIAGAALGVVGLLGWLSRQDLFKVVIPGRPPMMPTTCALLVLLGVGGALRSREAAPRWQKALAIGAGALVVAMASAILAEYILGVDLGVDQLVLRTQAPGPFPGRPSPLSTLAFVMLGGALVTLDVAVPRGAHPQQWLSLAAATVAFVALVGHLYGAGLFYHLGSAPAIGVALHTGVALLLIAIGLLLMRPSAGIMGLVTSPGPGGRLIQRLGAASILTPILVGLILTRALDPADQPLKLAVWTTATAVISAALVVAAARRLERTHGALEASRARLDSIISIAADAIVSIDDEQRITMFNQGAEDTFGWTKDEILGQPLSILIPGRTRERHCQDVKGFALESVKARRMAGRRPVHGLRKNGEEFPAEAAISRLESDTGRTFTVILRDITAQEKHLAELRLQGTIAAHLSEGILLHRTEDAEIVYANPRFEEMFGYSPGELIGKHLSVIHAPGALSPEQAAEGRARQLRRSGMWSGEIESIKNDGTHFWCHESASTFDHPQFGPVWVSVHTDISERKRLEEERALVLREKDVLLKEIHHRVKNNLQVLSSLFHLQAQRSEDPELRQLLGESQGRVQAIALVHDQLYRSDNLAEIDFGDYLRAVGAGIQATYGARRIKVEVNARGVLLDIEHAVPCGLLASELVSNALKHAFPGGRAGRVEVSAREDGERTIVLEVADDGVGIPEGVDWGGGRTLGLKLVQALTAQLQGTIALDRSRGTRFTVQFQLPRGPASGREPT